MTELRVDQDIQRELLSIETSPGTFLFLQPDPLRLSFVSGSVVINDWMTILDAPNENAPYAVIGIAETFDARGVQTNDGSVLWEIPIDLVEKFVDYQSTRMLLATHRQLIIDKLTRPNYYNNASGILAFGIRSVRARTKIYDIIERYDIPEQIRNRYPIYIYQSIVITVEEKSIG